jgi:hypothetical protein
VSGCIPVFLVVWSWSQFFNNTICLGWRRRHWSRNYPRGRPSSRWRTNTPTFEQVSPILFTGNYLTKLSTGIWHLPTDSELKAK